MPALFFQKPINSSLSALGADRLLFYLCFSLLHCTGQPEQCPEQPDGCFFIERSAANSAMPINARKNGGKIHIPCLLMPDQMPDRHSGRQRQ